MGCTNTSKKQIVKQTKDWCMSLIPSDLMWEVFEPKGGASQAPECSGQRRRQNTAPPPAQGMLCSQGDGQQCHRTTACSALLHSHGAHTSSWDGGKEGRILITQERHLTGLQEAAKSLGCS